MNERDKYRAWESINELVEDERQDCWYSKVDTEIGTVPVACFKISALSPLTKQIVLGGIEPSSAAVVLSDLYDDWTCADSPLGPWIPCGRSKS